MNAVETLARFFQAENDRDWEAYRTFLHEDVVWHLHGEEDRTIRGVEEYLRAIRDAYAGSGARFRVEETRRPAEAGSSSCWSMTPGRDPSRCSTSKTA